MEEMFKATYEGRGRQSFHTHQGKPPFRHLPAFLHFPNPEALQTLSFRGFYRGFITWSWLIISLAFEDWIIKHTVTQEISKVLVTLCQELETKTKYIFLLDHMEQLLTPGFHETGSLLSWPPFCQIICPWRLSVGTLLCISSLLLGRKLQTHVIPHTAKGMMDQAHRNNPPKAPTPYSHTSLALRKSSGQKNQRHTYAKTKRVVNPIISSKNVLFSMRISPRVSSFNLYFIFLFVVINI